MNSRLSQVRDIFDEIAELPRGERGAALARLCGGDDALRGEVESLLRTHDSQGLLSAPTIVAPEGGARAEGPGTTIGAYKLLQAIGEGGFGIVYMAEQERPVRRKVALKIIKLGMDTRQVIARFEAERQALAMMDHPNIARVLDAGATEAGRPYFVMELVRGVPITDYCDTNKLTPRERLDLFIQVCHAVQHAHQKGVIHRDIKPSNVLVTLHDGRPVPKVIDFGIAKATSQRLTDKTLFTEFRQFIGTPEYMSPEQAEMSGLDVDTRADIYSLGVLLYELLTGTTPFEASALRGQALDKIQRIIRETDPPLPSTRVGALTGSAARTAAVPTSNPSQATTAHDVAKHRRTDPASLGRLLKGDLDWIVMKAIEKDRTRRYETATALAADVVRYLSDEPVEAGPPSGVYRLRKFAKRNRVWLLTSGIAAGAFTLAFVGVVYGLLEARAGRADAVRAQREAEGARVETQQALERARRESDRNRLINEYLQEAVSGRRASGTEDVPLADVLDRGRTLFGGDHAAVASALTAWASTRRAMGDAVGAERALREAGDMLARMHGQSDSRVWNARLLQARAIADQPGREVEAEGMFRGVVDALRVAPGPGSPEYAVACEALVSHLLSSGMAGRESEIAGLWRQAVDAYERAYGPMDRRTVQEMCQLGQWLALRGPKDAAGPVLREAVRRGEQAGMEEDSAQFMAINSLILLELSQNGDYAEAAGWYDRLVEMGDRMGGEYAKGTPAMRLQIAGIWARAGRRDLALDRARAFVTETDRRGDQLTWESALRVEMSIDWVAPVLEDDPEVGRRVQIIRARGADATQGGLTTPPATTKHLAGVWLESHGYAADAEPILARAVAMRREATPPDQRALGESLAALGRARLALGRFEEAQACFREALSILQSGEGARSPGAYVLQHQIARTMVGQHRLDEAAALLEAWSPREGSDRDVVSSHAAAMAALAAARGG